MGISKQESSETIPQVSLMLDGSSSTFDVNETWTALPRTFLGFRV